MRKLDFAYRVRFPRLALLLAGVGIQGTVMIHPHSWAGQARPVSSTGGEWAPAGTAAFPADEDCDTNGGPEPCDMDCNANANPDDLDIYMAASRDCDLNRVPDECQATEPGDLDGDGVVNAKDRTSFAACHRPLSTGIAPGCESADQNGDGRVDCVDWAVIRCAWTSGEAPAYARCRAPSEITSLGD